jgi:hypothetical protein
MKKIIVAILTLISGMSVALSETIYVVNSLSATGTFNAVMSAYARDLGKTYKVNYIQGTNCQKSQAIIQKLIDNKQSVFFIWQGVTTAENLSNQTNRCIILPEQSSFIRADLKYSMFYALKTNALSDDFLSLSPKKVGYNGNIAKSWLTKFVQHHKLNWTLIQYNNSNEGYLGILNREIDFAYTNSSATFWKNSSKLTGLFSMNPQGEKFIPSLSTVSDFTHANVAQADFFVYYGPDIDQFRKVINQVHSTDSSAVSDFYRSVNNLYVDTLSMPQPDAVEKTNSAIADWQKINGR